VMPHANDKALFEKIIGQMKSVKVMSLSEFQGRQAKAINDAQYPGVGKTDSDVYENNFVEVMQFVLDHTTFDPSNDVDAAFLSAMKSLGLEPGKATDQNMAARFDGKRFRAVADAVRKSEFSRLQDAAEMANVGTNMFLPKGQISQDILLVQSVIGPIGLPASEALYPPVNTRDGQPMNALNDYVVHMSRDGLPPARAFWSLTLYDSANGFFIPNDRKKYSVGENAGMVLNDDGGIDVYVAAEKPAGVPDENWLPINRKDEKLDMIMRIYQPDMEKFKSYKVPEAEIISTH
jgi:hypothetical protein